MYIEKKKEKMTQGQRKNSTPPFAEKDTSFLVHQVSEGDVFFLETHPQNRIFFIIKGSLALDDPRVERKIFRRKHMYFLHRREASYKVFATDNLIAVEYRSDLLPSINQQELYKLIRQYAPQPKNLEELEIQKPMYHLISSIIYLKKQNLQSKFLFDIKKEELLYFLRTLYDKKEIARFVSPFLQDQNEFRTEIYSRYTTGDTVTTLAEKCFMTTKTLTRHFKKEFSITPYKWLTLQKTREIELHLIRHNSMPLKELADKFDFPSVKAFIDFCKTHQIWR